MKKRLDEVSAKQLSMLYSGRKFEYKTERYTVSSIIRTKVDTDWYFFINYESDVNGRFSREFNDFFRKFREVRGEQS